MAIKKDKPKCRTCGGYCGKRKGQRCQFAENEAKRQYEEIWRAVTAGMKAQGDEHAE